MSRGQIGPPRNRFYGGCNIDNCFQARPAQEYSEEEMRIIEQEFYDVIEENVELLVEQTDNTPMQLAEREVDYETGIESQIYRCALVADRETGKIYGLGDYLKSAFKAPKNRPLVRLDLYYGKRMFIDAPDTVLDNSFSILGTIDSDSQEPIGLEELLDERALNAIVFSVMGSNQACGTDIIE